MSKKKKPNVKDSLSSGKFDYTKLIYELEEYERRKVDEELEELSRQLSKYKELMNESALILTPRPYSEKEFNSLKRKKIYKIVKGKNET